MLLQMFAEFKTSWVSVDESWIVEKVNHPRLILLLRFYLFLQHPSSLLLFHLPLASVVLLLSAEVSSVFAVLLLPHPPPLFVHFLQFLETTFDASVQLQIPPLRFLLLRHFNTQRRSHIEALIYKNSYIRP